MEYKKVRRIGNQVITVNVSVTVSEYVPPWSIYTYCSLGRGLLEEAHFEDEETALRHLDQRLNFFAQRQSFVESELCYFTEPVEVWVVDVEFVPRFVQKQKY